MWQVWTLKGPTLQLSDDQLREQVALGKLTGLEEVRRGDEARHPLYELPWFATLAGEPEADPHDVAMSRKYSRGRRIAWNIVGGYTMFTMVCVSVAGMADLKNNGAAIAVFTATSLGAWIAAAIRKRRVAKARVEASHHGLVTEDQLTAVIDGLAEDIAQKPDVLATTLVNPVSLRRCAEQLRQQREMLESMSIPARARKQELEEARAHLAKATNEKLKDALSDQVRSLEAIAESSQRIDEALVENGARARALQHQVQAFRTALASGQLEAHIDHAAVEKLSALQEEIASDARAQRRMVPA